MGRQDRCAGTTQAGKPCQSFAISERGFCVSHDPQMQEMKREGSRRGGEAKANARRVAKQWRALGEEITADALPSVLNACMVAVWEGSLLPAQAQAIAALARTSVEIAAAREDEDRFRRLEEAAGIVPLHSQRRKAVS